MRTSAVISPGLSRPLTSCSREICSLRLALFFTVYDSSCGTGRQGHEAAQLMHDKSCPSSGPCTVSSCELAHFLGGIQAWLGPPP